LVTREENVSAAAASANKAIYPRANNAKYVTILTIWPNDQHRHGLGEDY
jgi:hypothetical protein